MVQSLKKMIEELPDYFIPEAAQGINVVAQLDLQDDPVDYWVLSIKDGQCTTENRQAISPQLTLSAKSQDLFAILAGELDITKAYMQGKISFTGKFTLALKMLELFNLPESYQKRLGIG